MPLRPEERTAIEDLLDFLSRERNTTLDGADGPEPPDWLGEDRATKAVIAIEHTRVEPRDLASQDHWKRLHDEVYKRAEGVVPGLFFIGQARPDQRFPTSKKMPLENVAQRIVNATAEREWSARYETWEVSPTQAPDPEFWVRVMLVDPDGSEMWGIPPMGGRHPHEVIIRFRDAVKRKARDLHAKVAHADEHILLIDVTAVHPAALGEYVEHLVDVMETLRFQALPVPTAVYFRGKDATGKTAIRLIWPSSAPRVAG